MCKCVAAIVCMLSEEQPACSLLFEQLSIWCGEQCLTHSTEPGYTRDKTTLTTGHLVPHTCRPTDFVLKRYELLASSQKIFCCLLFLMGCGMPHSTPSKWGKSQRHKLLITQQTPPSSCILLLPTVCPPLLYKLLKHLPAGTQHKPEDKTYCKFRIKLNGQQVPSARPTEPPWQWRARPTARLSAHRLPRTRSSRSQHSCASLRAFSWHSHFSLTVWSITDHQWVAPREHVWLASQMPGVSGSGTNKTAHWQLTGCWATWQTAYRCWKTLATLWV